MRIAVIASFTYSLTNFRLQLLREMVKAGHEVIAFAPDPDPVVAKALEDENIRFVQIPMARTGLNPLQDLHTLVTLWRQFRQLKPDIVLPYTMKPVIYACLAARAAGVSRRFALITGLGQVFATENPKGRQAVLQRLSVALYRVALRGVDRVFVYNDADDRDIRKHKLIDNYSLISLIPGSGVDLSHYTMTTPPTSPPVFLLIARLLREKGICEFVEAVRHLRQRFPDIRAQLLGPFEPNAAGISQADIDKWTAEGLVEYLGETRDVRPYFANCSVFVLPSYYREGIPRSILEAMASGRAIVTTDLPGCRDTVVEGQNGYLVPPRDPLALAKAMESFIATPSATIEMGRRSNQIARERFNVHAVNRLLLTQMGLS
ncbi:glycosyltransferase family 4 protein [Nordella sp. HKS 07]|uniref:glycosyltransferase family 4 protein n=1 Tax=Nordella sp. HKS 07 TaxID=2712222 RepID=UPI0013E14C58|nr:glycosyltransferase family 4 protein [Nordella sp. HKS 07]QIG49939.1 glycosyltransferase family 4 protein [Nordella sp. HKS 07]